MDPKICFICNCVCVNYNKNLFEIKSKYSETRISDFVVKILGDFPFKREYSVECDDNLVCNDCLNKVNEYDLACLTTKRVENELRELLVKTALSHAVESDTPIEPMHQLFTESTESTELGNEIKIEESNSLDYETIEALDREPEDADEVVHYAPSNSFGQIRKASVEVKDEQLEFMQSQNKHGKKRIMKKETIVKTNCYTCQTCNRSFNTNSVYEVSNSQYFGI